MSLVWACVYGGGYFKVATGIVCVVFLERAWSVTVLFCCKQTVFMYCIHSVLKGTSSKGALWALLMGMEI